ncbi:MAG TPA: NADH-quinone oxidoreductase subunit N [Chthoniobacteraceae bacterium]|jgi:NADH-quinone oxidoreductase subunit N|nr:NADH-quinone oxidoreductase subunit N [Chthoniobacteraceae bacterium]
MFSIAPIFLEVAVLVTGLFLLIYESFANDREKGFLAALGIGALSLIFIASFFAVPSNTVSGSGMLHFYCADPLALFFKRFALLTTIIVLVISLEYRDVVRRFIFGTHSDAGIGEFYTIPIFTCAGLMFMASAVDFIMIFVSLELVTISFYVLVAYMRRSANSLEAGVKYLVLGALSTGFFVYGVTWIFGLTGKTNLSEAATVMQHLHGGQTPMIFGFMLILMGLGFKVAAAPFQFWVPDVYQGAPTPITAFLSVGSKAAGFIVLIRVITTFLSVPALHDKIIAIISVVAALTLIYGNLAAMPQNNLKRLLAYSSIAHAGYLLMAVASLDGVRSTSAVAFYLTGYLLMTMLSFAIIVVVANATGGDDISNFNGLGKRAPGLAFAMLVAMLSLAGVPLTVGFFGKFFVFAAAISQGHYVLAMIGVVTVGAGFYYYLKVVRAMYWLEGAGEMAAIPVAPLTRFTMVALAALIFIFGIYPAPILNMLSPKAGADAWVTASK